MTYLRTLTGLMLAAWLAIPVGSAHAVAVFSDAVLVKGPEYLTVLELPIDAIGTYNITATDLKWLDTPLKGLSFGVFTSGQLLKSMQGPGTFEFYKASSDKVFLQVYAQSNAPKFAGLVSIVVAAGAAAVSLPSSLVLLMSGIGAAMIFRKRPVQASQYDRFA